MSLTREKIIDELYRSIRDALNNFLWARREKNNVIVYLDNKKITVSFRIKIEDSDVKQITFYEAVGDDDQA